MIDWNQLGGDLINAGGNVGEAWLNGQRPPPPRPQATTSAPIDWQKFIVPGVIVLAAIIALPMLLRRGK